MELLKLSAHERRTVYLRRAREADEKAAVATDPLTRDAWCQIAESWRFMADEFLHIGKPPKRN